MTIIALPKILREKLTDEGAEALIEMMNQVEQRSQLAILELADERCEKRLSRLDAKIDTTTATLEAKIGQTTVTLNSKIDTTTAALEAKIDRTAAGHDAKIETKASELDAKMERIRANMIQWMFVFWAGQIGATTAILFAFFK